MYLDWLRTTPSGHGSPRASSENSEWAEKIRLYSMFKIETSPDLIYGEGYRRVAAATRDLGFQEVLEFIILSQKLPET